MNVPRFVRASVVLAAFVLLAALPERAVAQYTNAPPPAAYALQGVTVVQADGRRQEGVDVVVRGRFIEAIGRGLEIPADARVLEGEGLIVYPGFVDAQGKVKYSFPEVEAPSTPVAPWDPPRELQGFTPHRRVVDVLQATSADLADQRKKGIVAAAVYPTDALMPGRGALVMMRADARTPMQTVLVPELGPVMTLRGGRRAYPGTLFGVLAFYRQQFENARHAQEVALRFARDPRGIEPPAYDPDIAVLQEVMQGRAPVFFAVDRAEDIRRVLNIAQSNGLRPIIVGGREAWKVATELEKRNVPVLVSLDFPKGEFYDPEKHGDKADAELDAAVLKEKRELEAAYANAARLAEAGVRFALTSGGGEADLLEGARKAIEYGLDEMAALRALTATPAELFGIGYVARIEAGLPATFVVASGPLFDEGTSLRYTFVEGALEEIGGAEKRGGANGRAGQAANVTGEWSVDVESPEGGMSMRMTLAQEGAAFTGSLNSAEFGTMRIIDGAVAGSEVRFTVVVEMGGQSMEVHFTATIEGDEMRGSGSGPMGTFSFTARRASGPGGVR